MFTESEKDQRLRSYKEAKMQSCSKVLEGAFITFRTQRGSSTTSLLTCAILRKDLKSIRSDYQSNA